MSLILTVDLSDRAYEALKALADAIGAKTTAAPTPAPAPAPAPAPTPAPSPAVLQPVNTAPAPADAPPFATQPLHVPKAAPAAAPAPAPVPTAPAPTYTLEQLTVAAAPLIDQGKLNELCGVIASFGVQSLQELPPERYGEYATAIRALGAKI